MMPSSAVLVGLGKALGVSLDFLLGGQVETLRSVEWRKNPAASARDRAMAEALVIEKLEDHLAIEAILDLPATEDPFRTLRVHHLADGEAIDAAARAVREEWRLGIDPIPSMTALLEDKGLKVIETDLPERINGLACHVERVDASAIEVIVVARNTNVERKRFNLAHELAHRVITATGNADLRKEPAMNRFAGAFLIPRDHLGGESGRASPPYGLGRDGAAQTHLRRLRGRNARAPRPNGHPAQVGHRIRLQDLCPWLAGVRNPSLSVPVRASQPWKDRSDSSDLFGGRSASS